MDGNSVIIWVIIGIAGFILIAGLGIVALLLFARKRYRELENLPVTRISEAADGQVIKLRGSVLAADQKLSDPITGRECVAYHAWVSCESEQGRGPRRNWSQVILAKKKEQMEFLLHDRTGLARIKPPLAISGLRCDGEADHPRVERFLRDADVQCPEKQIFPGVQLIREDDTVRVVGLARRIREGSKGETLVVEPRSEGTVWVADGHQKV